MYGKTFEKKSGFDPIKKGKYTAICENCTLEETKNGTQFIQMVFVINDGSDFDGRKLWHKMWFTEKSYDMTSQQLENAWVFEKLPETETIEQFREKSADALFQLVNKKFNVSVTGHNEYNGKEYPNTFLSGYADAPNLAIQTEPPKASESFDSSEEIPF